MPPTGIEPVTLGLLDPRSNRLSYEGRYYRDILSSAFMQIFTCYFITYDLPLLDDATPSSPFFYLSICSVIDSEILLTSAITSDSGAVQLYPNSVSDAKNSSLGTTNSNVFYSDGELIQLKYTEGSACSSGKVTLLYFHINILDIWLNTITHSPHNMLVV